MVLENFMKNGTDIKTFVLSRGEMEIRIPKPMEYISFLKEYKDILGAEGRSDASNIALILKNFSANKETTKASLEEIEESLAQFFLPIDTVEVWGWFMSLSGVMNDVMKEAMKSEDFRRRK